MRYFYFFTKSIIVLALAITSCLHASAYDFEVNGIYYNITDEINKTVEVTSGSPEYSGSVVIPTKVTYHYYNTSVTYSVRTIRSYAFKGCEELISINIPNSVTSIGQKAFSGCSGLAELTIEDGTETLSLGSNDYYEGLFYDCPLEKIYLGRSLSYDTDYRYGYSPFYNINELKSVTISNYATRIGHYTFYKCSGLTSITIEDGTETLLLGYEQLMYCPIEKLYLGRNLSYDKTSPFYGKTTLKSATIGNSVTEIGEDAFSLCNGLTSIVVESSNPKYDSRNNCNAIIESESNTLIAGCKNTTIPNSVTKIGNWAFGYCSGLTSVTIPNSVTSIGKYAFHSCNGLTKVAIPPQVTEIGDGAFYECTGLTEVTIPNSVTSIGQNAFFSCSGLTSITIPNSMTSISDWTFNNCSGLTSVTIPNSMTSIGKYAFYDCYGITEVNIFDLSAWCKIEFEHAFSNPTSTGSLLRGNTTKLMLNGKEIKDLVIPNDITQIKSCSFYGTSISSVTIPNSVTDIAGHAFNRCSGLTSVTIGNSVTKIGGYAFRNCSLDVVTSYCKTPPVCGSDAFNGSYSALLNVPEGTKEAYANANEWCNFTNIQEIAGVENIEIDNNATEVGRYDIHGKLLTEPTKGINIIKMSNGTTRKEMVK